MATPPPSAQNIAALPFVLPLSMPTEATQPAPVATKQGVPPRIPLSNPYFDADDAAAVMATLQSGWVSTASPQVTAFEEMLAYRLGSPAVVATNSGTAALHLALRAMSLGHGQGVWLPALTFAATANPVFYCGAQPHFADIELAYLGVSVDSLEQAHHRATRTGAPLPVGVMIAHLYGLPCPMPQLMAWAQAHGLWVIEDAAEALGAVANGQAMGTVAQLGAFSFNGNKVMTTGSGGALACHSAEQAKWLRGLSAQARVLGSPELEHGDIGHNYRMNALQAALGQSQLTKVDAFIARRQNIALRYQQALADQADHVRVLTWQGGTHPTDRASYWLSMLYCREASWRLPLIELLQSRGIESRPLFKPLVLQSAYRGTAELADAPKHYPNALWAWQHGLCLPSSPQMSDAEQDEVIAVIKQWVRQQAQHEASPQPWPKGC
jgi:dTDP-4-amino-4,6-dideoxygalactose transaminase